MFLKTIKQQQNIQHTSCPLTDAINVRSATRKSSFHIFKLQMKISLELITYSDMWKGHYFAVVFLSLVSI